MQKISISCFPVLCVCACDKRGEGVSGSIIGSFSCFHLQVLFHFELQVGVGTEDDSVQQTAAGFLRSSKPVCHL